MAQSDYNIFAGGEDAATVFGNIAAAHAALRSKNSGAVYPNIPVIGEEFLLMPSPADGFWYLYQYMDTTIGWVERWRINTATGAVTLDGSISIADVTGLSAALVTAGNGWQSVWHPWNAAAENDGATGEIWSFAANGAVALVTSPDFVDGWEYAFWFDQVQTSGSNVSFSMDIFRETTNAWVGAYTIFGTQTFTSGGPGLSGMLDTYGPRKTRRNHYIELRGLIDTTSTINALFTFTPEGFRVRNNVAQKLLRMRFSFYSGNITGSGSTGRIFMYKRKDLTT